MVMVGIMGCLGFFPIEMVDIAGYGVSSRDHKSPMFSLSELLLSSLKYTLYIYKSSHY